MSTTQKHKKVVRLLQRARNKYENKLLEIEKLWAKINPRDYDKRKLLLEITDDMIDLDKGIKEWEDKLKL